MFEPTGIRKRWVIAGMFLTMVVTTYCLAQMQDFQNRSEGTTVHVDALEDFILVGLHRDFKSFPRNANLNVRFFLPNLHDSPKGNVVVEAVELQDSVHYLMRSKNAPAKEVPVLVERDLSVEVRSW